MDDYNAFAHLSSKLLTEHYSTSFSKASGLFPAEVRAAIYDIYVLVRIADEIVDTYDGPDMLKQLDDLELETVRAIKSGYSSNIIVHAYAQTAKAHDIGPELLAPFFASMRVDATGQKRFNAKEYKLYIYGSAEVIGLMCLKVFCAHSAADYDALKPGAQALGSAFQKINFLRDIASDYEDLGRYYFPVGDYESFSDKIRDEIVNDIAIDLVKARAAIIALPLSVKVPVAVAYNVYYSLFLKLQKTPSEYLLQNRVRVPDYQKLYWLWLARCGVLRGSKV